MGINTIFVKIDLLGEKSMTHVIHVHTAQLCSGPEQMFKNSMLLVYSLEQKTILSS
jgi:hypothetical protein